VIAVSETVRETLVKEFGVSSSKLDVINGSVTVPEFSPEIRARKRRDVLKRLGWSEDSFVVGGCGAMGWRKGTDVFLQVAKELCGTNPDNAVRFLWVGGAAAGDETLRFRKETQLFGLEGRCQCLPTTGEVADFYMAMDAFALTSREDPYPLVMLEAGACHVPTVCFEKSGGGPEYVGTDAGLIAPYLNVREFAAHLESLRKSPELRARLGAAAADKVRTRHVVETQGPKILESIRRCLSEK
jgi:glycosyltransferase involved in cell wall biosynthesis